MLRVIPLTIRIYFVLLLLAVPGLVKADATGILFELGGTQADWEFSDHSREAKDSSLAVRIEERSDTGLAVGGIFAYQSLRLDDRQGSGSTKFEVTSLGVYLRQEFAFNEWSGLEGQLDYRFHTGRENTDDDRAELDWSEVDFELGRRTEAERGAVFAGGPLTMTNRPAAASLSAHSHVPALACISHHVARRSV